MMKFDSSSIYNRAVGKLNQDPDWTAITNNSVISSLIKSNAEINSEIARYGEYLFKESKYDTAQNYSSILSMANMLGYQPKRKISATGTLFVSLDPRTHLIGKEISMETVEEEVGNLSKNTLNWVPNIYNYDIIINPSSTITDSLGNSYVSIGSKSLKVNSKGVYIDVIQGTRKSTFIDIDTIRQTSTKSKLYPYLYIPFTISNCENASSSSSRGFFKVYLVKSNGNDEYSYDEYRVVDNLLLSESIDKDVEVYNDLYSQDLFYLKFDNDSSMGSILDLSSNTSLVGIRIEYLESLGSAGNIDNLYENFTITNTLKPVEGKGEEYSGIKLYGVNKTFIVGGHDEEDITSIKNNATKFYISNYSVGTKESYENTVLNTVFRIDPLGEIKPKKVRVYGGVYLNPDTGIKQPVTYITFISDNLEDLATSGISTEQYLKIEESLNYYLGRLKSPQDTIKFEVPEYVALAFDIDCTIDGEATTEGLSVIESNIMNLVDSQWGPNSNYIDFGNSFSPSGLSTSIMKTYTEVKSVDIEVEAVKKLMWDRARKINTNPQTAQSIYTCRIPFEFSPVFIGNQVFKGFKDFRTGSKYMMRFDILYKKPNGLLGSSLNKSIFIEEPGTGRIDTSFSVRHDQDNIWNFINSNEYTEITDDNRIDSNLCYQVGFVPEVYSDNDFQDFKNRIDSGKESTKNSIVDLGALDNYLIYFSGDYDSNSSTIGYGWIEFTFDALYSILERFSLYDYNLKAKLENCPLSFLKCYNADPTLFSDFISIAQSYIDIYVSMRPIDNNLKLLTSNLSDEVLTSNSKSILYVDSYDNYSKYSNRENLTNIKKSRMISVKCSYEGTK